MRYLKNMVWVSILAGSFLVLGCGVRGGQGQEAQAGEVTRIEEFSLKDLEDKEVSFHSVLSGKKAVLVNFWATWCDICKEEIPDLIQLQAKYQDQGFTILSIDSGESATKVSRFAKKAGLNFPILLDSDQALSEKYNITGIPTNFLVGPDGRVIREFGAYNQEMEKAIQKAVSEPAA